MQAAEFYQLGCGAAMVYSAPAPGRESANEDAALLIPIGADAAVLAVADGVGGRPGGAEAAAAVISALLQHVAAGGTGIGDLRDAILTALEAANRRILALGNGAATTLALAELHGAALRTFHVGDSSVLVAGNRGRLKLETVAHSPVGYAVESGLLTESEAIVHDERHVVSNVLGSADLHISVGVRTPLAVRDTLLLATDGLFDNVAKNEIIEFVRKGPLPRCAAALADLARRRMSGQNGPGKPDDLTFILYRPAPVRRRPGARERR